MHTTDLQFNPVRDPIVPKLVLRNAFANRDFVLAVATFVKASDKEDYLGQKLLDALEAHAITTEEVDRLLPTLSYFLGITQMMGGVTIDWKEALRTLLAEFGGHLGARGFVENLRAVERTVTGGISEQYIQARILNSLFGDWGEPGDVEEITNYPGAYAAHPKEG